MLSSLSATFDRHQCFPVCCCYSGTWKMNWVERTNLQYFCLAVGSGAGAHRDRIRRASKTVSAGWRTQRSNALLLVLSSTSAICGRSSSNENLNEPKHIHMHRDYFEFRFEWKIRSDLHINTYVRLTSRFRRTDIGSQPPLIYFISIQSSRFLYHGV